jgi:hypothetical protein
MAPTRWADSADRHGVDHADALHAMKNAKTYVQRFDRSRVQGRDEWADLWIEPSRDGSVTLEVFAHLDVKARDVLIFHVMPVRQKTRDRVQQIIEGRRNQR